MAVGRGLGSRQPRPARKTRVAARVDTTPTWVNAGPASRSKLFIRVALLGVHLLVGCGRSPASVPDGPDGSALRKLVIRVPAGFGIERGLDALLVRIDAAALAFTEVNAESASIIGIESDVYAFARGQPRPDRGRHALVTGADFERTRAAWTTERDGIPLQGTKYVVEMNLVLFETDVPPAATAWNPHAGRYTVLWTRTLRQSEE